MVRVLNGPANIQNTQVSATSKVACGACFRGNEQGFDERNRSAIAYCIGALRYRGRIKKGDKKEEMPDLEKMHEKDMYPVVQTFLKLQKKCLSEYVGTKLSLKRGKTSLRADVFGVSNQDEQIIYFTSLDQRKVLKPTFSTGFLFCKKKKCYIITLNLT